MSQTEGSCLRNRAWWPAAKRLHERDGMSYAEIARLIGKDPRTVYKAINNESYLAKRRSEYSRKRNAP